MRQYQTISSKPLVLGLMKMNVVTGFILTDKSWPLAHKRYISCAVWTYSTALHKMQTWSMDENSVSLSNGCIV